MNCHTCPHAPKIAEGEFQNSPWPETPCAHCDSRDPQSYAIAYNDAQETLPLPSSLTESDPRNPVLLALDPPEPEDWLPISVLEEFINRFLTLQSRTREVVALRFSGKTYTEIGQSLNMTRAGAEACHQRAMQQFPEIRELFPKKAGNSRKPPQIHRPISTGITK